MITVAPHDRSWCRATGEVTGYFFSFFHFVPFLSSLFFSSNLWFQQRWCTAMHMQNHSSVVNFCLIVTYFYGFIRKMFTENFTPWASLAWDRFLTYFHIVYCLPVSIPRPVHLFVFLKLYNYLSSPRTLLQCYCHQYQTCWGAPFLSRD
jgi:hypothetical protein